MDPFVADISLFLNSKMTDERQKPLFFRSIITVLQCICKSCSRILLKPELADSYREKIRAREIPYLTKKNLRKKIVDLCKKVSTCHHCGDLVSILSNSFFYVTDALQE
jgi:DNA-directed RNA polymerase beta' subunit